jgi:carbonic anhydrase/acetyltransferase-like protein (isoleucine patch superfamily)
MLYEHLGKRPRIDASSHIAPNAVICGDVTIGPNCSVGFGAVLTAESGPITIGTNVVVMDAAVMRGVVGAPIHIGDNVLIGPHASLSGCDIGDEVFVATGACLFNGAKIGARSEIRIKAVVHIKTVLPEDTIVPINWVAVGNPAQIFPPDQHDRIWAMQKLLDFPRHVFGVDRPPKGETMMTNVMPRYAGALRKGHGNDRLL